MLFPPDVLLTAYAQGHFPMAFEDGSHYWFDPDPRAVMPLDERFHVSRRLARTLRQGRFEITRDQVFREVVEACAAPSEIGRDRRESSWISEEIAEGFLVLHRLGYAHSLEVWREGELIGGIYGLALGGFFAGESMFSRERDASKIALVKLVHHLRRQRFTLFDVQFLTPHLATFGAYEMPRDAYKRRLRRALSQPVMFTLSVSRI